MTRNLLYGDGHLKIPLSNEGIERELLLPPVSPIENIEKAAGHVLDHPVDSAPFDEVFGRGDRVTIVVSDITRKIGTEQFLPVLVERLNRLGIRDQDIVVLIANGTHRPATDLEKAAICGETLCRRIRVVSHDCDSEHLVNLGTTPRGTPVRVNRLIVERKVLLTGAIAHHPLAGFSGGRKGIVPGVAGRETIRRTHLYGLDPHVNMLNPLARTGRYVDNTVHLDMVDCVKLVKPDFMFNVIAAPDGRHARMVGGHWLYAWEEGVRWVAGHYEATLSARADVVVASAGGYPKDMSFYQTVMSLLHASFAVKPGGTLLLLAECREGAGPDDFFAWNKALIQGRLYEELRRSFTISGHVFCLAYESCKDKRVVLISEIDPGLLRPLGIEVFRSPEDAFRHIGGIDSAKNIVVIPEARVMVPAVPGSYEA